MQLERAFRRRTHTAFALLLAASALGAVGCNDDNDTGTGPVNPTYLINVTPGNNTLAVGGTQQLTAAAVDFYNNPVTGQTITWESSIPAVATVSATGLVTMVKAGSTTIVARSGGAYGVAVVSSPSAVASINVGAPTTLAIPLTLQLSPVALDAAGGQLLPSDVTYSSSAPTILSVSTKGLLTAIAPGSAVITVTAGGKTGTATVQSIVFTPVASVSLGANTMATLAVNGTLQLNPVIKDTPGNVLTGKPVTYTSSAPTVASVSATGLVTQLTAGSAMITATSETKSGYIGVTTSTLILQNNVSVGPLGGPTGSNLVYSFLVPPGSTAGAITLTGGTGDPDLYGYKPGVAVDLTANNIGTSCFSFNDVAINETCTVSAANIATAGVWSMQVNGFATFAGWTLKANVTTP